MDMNLWGGHLSTNCSVITADFPFLLCAVIPFSMPVSCFHNWKFEDLWFWKKYIIRHGYSRNEKMQMDIRIRKSY